jgi:hypothetical protein
VEARLERAAGRGHARVALVALGVAACQPHPSEPAPPTTPGVDCSHYPEQFPSFDKTCATADDCARVFHTVGCCGGQTALGIRRSESARFEAAKDTCEGQFAGRNCPECVTRPPTSIEDGTSSWRDEPIGVDCWKGRCTSVLQAE